MPSLTVKDVDQHEFVVGMAAFLKKSGKLNVPDWTDIAKTGIYKELCPNNADWFYVRCAALLRQLYYRGQIGEFTFIRLGRSFQKLDLRPLD